MNFYPHHIGDFRSGTIHMSRLVRWIYRDMIDVYYDTEKPLPLELDELCDLIGVEIDEERRAVQRVLRLKFEKTEDGYIHERCDIEIAEFQKKGDVARENGKKGGRRKNPEQTQQEPTGLPETTQPLSNQEPVTSNQEPIQTPMATDPENFALVESSSDDMRMCPVGQIVNLYHEMMPNNPRVKVINEARKSAIRQRWREAARLDCKPFGYSTKSEGLAAWRRFFEVCATSQFLTGLSPPSAGKRAFIADLEFIFSPSGFAKILENKYHRETKP